MKREDLFKWAEERFDTKPDYPWDSSPNFAVLRGANKKWFALVMDISKKHLGLPENEIADVLNVKCDPLLIGSLRLKDGYYPAYHMNKDKWISVLLDGTVPEEEIKALIELSYNLTQFKKK